MSRKFHPSYGAATTEEISVELPRWYAFQSVAKRVGLSTCGSSSRTGIDSTAGYYGTDGYFKIIPLVIFMLADYYPFIPE
jgi:hypothetical protein